MNVLEECEDEEDFDFDAQNSQQEVLSLQGPSRRSLRSGGHAVAAAGPAMRSSSSAVAPPASNACGSAPGLMDANAHCSADDAAPHRESEGNVDDSDDDADDNSIEQHDHGHGSRGVDHDAETDPSHTQKLLETAKKAMHSLAGAGSDAQDLYLPTVFTNDQRAVLHDHADSLGLFHRSTGPTGCRQMRVSNNWPCFIITPQQARDLEGAQVARKTTTGTLERGHVIEYEQATVKWKVKFDHEEIQVDLDGLNEMVHIRFSDEFPGRRARTAPYQSATEYDKHLKKLLDGCDLDAWKKPLKSRKFCNYDTRHWMQKFGDMLAAPPGTPAHNLFFQLLSDALFTILPGEHSRVKFFLRTQRNLSEKDVAGMKRNYWRRNCRYSCEPPDVLLPRIYFMYKFFCTLDQADNEETKVLKDNHERIFMKEIKHVQQGLLSDPPGV